MATSNPIRVQWSDRLAATRSALVSERKAYGSALTKPEAQALSLIISALKDLSARTGK